MALALTLNGVTTATIPGAPANGDRIAMSNGTLRVSFTWNTHGGARWNVDLLEYSPDSGTTWNTVLYARDTPRIGVPGVGEVQGTNGALSIVTNTASALTLQLAATAVSGVTYTMTSQFSMTTSQPNCEVSQFLAMSGQVSIGSGQKIEDWGPCYWSAGLSTSSLALYSGIASPFNSSRVNPTLWSGNLTAARIFSQPANTNRGYGDGMSMYLAGNYLVSFVVKPASYKNLATGILDPSTNLPQGGLDWIFAKGGYVNFFKTIDGAYQSVHDTTPTFVRPGTRFVGTSTSPQSASSTDSATTLNLTWSICVEQPTATGTTGLAIPRYLLPQAINKWQDTLYARPNVGSLNNPYFQTLGTLDSTIAPFLASTFTQYFESVYGYYQGTGTATLKHSYAAALALQTCLKWANLGVGNSDALTMADQLAVILANFQQQSGVQAGAFYKVRDTAGNKFQCQEGNHTASGDQPHVPSYNVAECILALIEYYRVRGNRTLAATYGNITVATLLDQAMAWLVKVQQSDGGFLVEYNNVNAATATSPHIGASYPGSATVDLAASMLQWSSLSPTASAASKLQWQQQGIRAALYWMTSESTAHGNFEYGEDFVYYTHHSIKHLVRGFARLYRLTGSPVFQEWMAYYFEQGILLCKRVDEIINNSATASQDVHTGGLMSTIDKNGVASGEVGSVWHELLTNAVALHPGLLAVHYFYMWAALAGATWAYRDSATYLSSYALSYAYASPGTSFCGSAQGLDNSRFLYFAPDGALHLLPTHTLVACDNANVFSTCIEAMYAVDKPAGRTIVLYNPQSGSQSVNLTVKGQAGKVVQQDGVSIAGTKSGADLLVGPLTLTSGQISKVTTR